ncbi:unnamed protein product, partial [Cylicostephanus goldi]
MEGTTTTEAVVRTETTTKKTTTEGFVKDLPVTDAPTD